MREPLIGGTAWFDRSVVRELIVHADAHLPNETGGLLAGYRHSAAELVVTAAIGAGPGARHHRASFEPDTQWQADALAKRYGESGRRLEYLGDWHTHPGGLARPSRMDRRTMRRIAFFAEARCEEPIMAILAGGDSWSLAIWQRTRSAAYGARINGLSLQPFGQ